MPEKVGSAQTIGGLIWEGAPIGAPALRTPGHVLPITVPRDWRTANHPLRETDGELEVASYGGYGDPESPPQATWRPVLRRSAGYQRGSGGRHRGDNRPWRDAEYSNRRYVVDALTYRNEFSQEQKELMHEALTWDVVTDDYGVPRVAVRVEFRAQDLRNVLGADVDASGRRVELVGLADSKIIGAPLRAVVTAIEYDLERYPGHPGRKGAGAYRPPSRDLAAPASDPVGAPAFSERLREGRRILNLLGVWPWAHAKNGELPRVTGTEDWFDYRNDTTFTEPLNVWHEAAHAAEMAYLREGERRAAEFLRWRTESDGEHRDATPYHWSRATRGVNVDADEARAALAPAATASRREAQARREGGEEHELHLRESHQLIAEQDAQNRENLQAPIRAILAARKRREKRRRKQEAEAAAAAKAATAGMTELQLLIARLVADGHPEDEARVLAEAVIAHDAKADRETNDDSPPTGAGHDPTEENPG